MASTGTVMPAPKYTAYDNNGHPLVGGKLYTYAAGTTTPAVTYSDVTLTIPNPNPIILDAGGRATVFLAPGAYKFLQKDANDVLIWSVDGITAVGPFNVSLDVTGIVGEDVLPGDVLYLETGTAGTAGYWYKADADFPARSSEAVTIGMAPTAIANGVAGAIRLQGQVVVTGPLSPGATYYVSREAGGLAALPPTNQRFVGQADSATSIMIAPNPSVGAPGDNIDGIAGEALSVNDVVWLSPTPPPGGTVSGRWYKTDSDNTYSSSDAATIGFAKANIPIDDTGPIQLSGRVTGLSGLTTGLEYFVAPTPGALINPAPTNIRLVGTADSVTSLVMAGGGGGGEEEECCDPANVDYLAIEALSMAGRAGIGLVSGGQPGIARVEHGFVFIDGGAFFGTSTITPPAAPNHTVLINLGATYVDPDAGADNITEPLNIWKAWLTLTNATTIRANRESAGNPMTVNYCAVHYNPNQLKTVQYGTIVAGPGTPHTGTITPVNTAKSFIHHLGWSQGYPDQWFFMIHRMQLLNSTTVYLTEPYGGTRFATFGYVVAEHW